MNVMRTIFALVWLAGLLPGMAQATDADKFVAASRSQQAVMLEQWAAAPDPARLGCCGHCSRKRSLSMPTSTPSPAKTVP